MTARNSQKRGSSCQTRENAKTRVDDSFSDAKIELNTICDATLREKIKEPTLQIHAKFEAPTLAADEVRMSGLAETSLYCQHHDITAEKWSQIYPNLPSRLVAAMKLDQ